MQPPRGWTGTAVSIEQECGAALKLFFNAAPPDSSADQRLKLNQFTFTKSAGWPLVNVR
jgi:hypothetical protein